MWLNEDEVVRLRKIIFCGEEGISDLTVGQEPISVAFCDTENNVDTDYHAFEV